MPGVLRVLVGGAWVDYPVGAEEVSIGASDPGVGYELWYDTVTTAPAIPGAQVDFGAWLNYTPVVTASTTAPSFGTTPTIVGRYIVIGKVVHWWVSMTAGGTGMAVGSGSYGLSMPVPLVGGGFQIVGSGWIYGAAGFKPFVCDQNPARMTRTDNGTALDQTCGPNAVGSVLAASGMYQAA